MSPYAIFCDGVLFDFRNFPLRSVQNRSICNMKILRYIEFLQIARLLRSLYECCANDVHIKADPSGQISSKKERTSTQS